MIISKKKALIGLRGRAGWSAPLLFANPEDRFSQVDADTIRSYNKCFDTTLIEPAGVPHKVQIGICVCSED